MDSILQILNALKYRNEIFTKINRSVCLQGSENALNRKCENMVSPGDGRYA